MKDSGAPQHTTRLQDMQAERMVAGFLDKYFYPRLMASNELAGFTREDDKLGQLSGVDIVLEVGRKRLMVDEKATTQYTNSGLPTFAFELSQRIWSGEVVDGWLLDSRLKTTHFLLVWPYSASGERGAALTGGDPLTWLEVALIEKASLLNWLGNAGLTIEQLRFEAGRFREEVERGADRKKQLTENLALHYFASSKYGDTQICETPVIITLKKREVLFPLADWRYHVFPDRLCHLNEKGGRIPGG